MPNVIIIPIRKKAAIAPFAARAIVMIVENPSGSLLSLGLILSAVFGAIAAVPAQVAAGLGRSVERRVSSAKKR
jgi:hypothetical protein